GVRKTLNTLSDYKELQMVLDEDSLPQCSRPCGIYAPQSAVVKRILWDYISGLINRWKGETIVLGDFNVVRFEEERFDSFFNKSCARAFNQFISSSGLLEDKMEGYSFTWSHLSATKMNHRPIILNEIHSDFHPTPFRIYHSWFKRDGFDAMVEQASLGAWWLLGIDGEGRGSGVEVVEWSVEWGREGCCRWREKRLHG
nr:RNA-directed DNA polymerase, eukaryota [Tanacetum cinerariifolium]